MNIHDTRNPVKGLVIITTLISIALIIYSIKLCIDTKNKKEYYIYTEAEVVEYKADKSSNGSTLYGIVAEYEVNGEKYKIYPNTYTSGKQPPKGSIVGIRYNPNSPSEAIWEVDNRWIAILIFGIVCIMAAGVVYIAFRGRI